LPVWLEYGLCGLCIACVASFIACLASFIACGASSL